ncbi:MAG: hypothetical protein HY390_05815 [Deltaproteobacteria bacterium]|nr:hypothetical protein [Deltaproteobacteria bacterium]
MLILITSAFIFLINPVRGFCSDRAVNRKALQFLYDLLKEKSPELSPLCQSQISFDPTVKQGKDSHDYELDLTITLSERFFLNPNSNSFTFYLDAKDNDLDVIEENGFFSKITYQSTQRWGDERRAESFTFSKKLQEGWEIKLTSKEWFEGINDHASREIICNLK